MDFGSSQLYTFELWSASGIRTADISRLARNRMYRLKRNDAEFLYFELDLYDFENYCASIGVNPMVLLNPLTTDVKVKRGGSYLFGTQVISAIPQLTPDSRLSTTSLQTAGQSFLPVIKVTCYGYLNLFSTRYVTASYTNTERCTVAGNLITATQAIANGNMGVTLNASQYNTGVTDPSRTYSRQDVKSELQSLAASSDARFDFAFDYNKVFTTYPQIGSKRTDIQLTFGGPQSNILGLYDERSGANVYNQIIGIGSGFGADAVASPQDDVDSQRNYFLRQDIKQYNNTTEQAVLDQKAKTDLALEKDLLDVPQITISGKELANLQQGFLSVGDRMPLAEVGHPFLANMNGVFRLEQMEVQLDDNDFEQAITLYFDNYAVNPNT